MTWFAGLLGCQCGTGGERKYRNGRGCNRVSMDHIRCHQLICLGWIMRITRAHLNKPENR